MGQKGLNFWRCHVFGMVLVVEQDIASNPLYVGFFGAVGIVFDP
jgi:hypothetical protein